METALTGNPDELFDLAIQAYKERNHQKSRELARRAKDLGHLKAGACFNALSLDVTTKIVKHTHGHAMRYLVTNNGDVSQQVSIHIKRRKSGNVVTGERMLEIGYIDPGETREHLQSLNTEDLKSSIEIVSIGGKSSQYGEMAVDSGTVIPVKNHFDFGKFIKYSFWAICIVLFLAWCNSPGGNQNQAPTQHQKRHK